MSPREIMEHLKAESFEPFVFVTNSGDRYEVKHPELARLTATGVVYIFTPSTREDAHYEQVSKLAARNIAAIEPLRKQTT